MTIVQCALLAIAALTFAGQPTPIVQSVDLAAPFPPVTFTQDGRTQLVYELHVTNFQRTDVTLATVRVESPGVVLGEHKGADLAQRIVRPGLRNDHATPQILAPGMRAVVNLWISLPDRFASPSVTNIVEMADTSVRLAVPVPSSQPQLVLGPPLGEGRWIAVYDPMLKGGHRTAIYTLEGRARIPGRFAIDFIRMPESGAWARTPEVSDWNGRGADVLAVADGTVAAALDGEPDDAPKPVPADKGSGNYVSLDLGNGRVVFYEHLLRGSVRVKAGQRVNRGDVIARLGSSGSTSIGPHLHFHVADANSLLAAEGMPFVFTQFAVFGSFASIDALHNGLQWIPAPSARSSMNSRPSPNSVISFR